MTLKLVFTASLLDVQHYGDSVEEKPASLLVVPLGKALFYFLLLFIFSLMHANIQYKNSIKNSTRM